MHLDATRRLVVERLVRKTIEVELASELGIDASQDVAVESFRDPGSIVVRGVQDRDVLLKVEADEKRVLGLQVLAKAFQEMHGFVAFHVSDARAEKQDEHAVGNLLVVGHDRARPLQTRLVRRRYRRDVELRIARVETIRRAPEHRLRDIDREVVKLFAGLEETFEQNGRFGRAAATELDEADGFPHEITENGSALAQKPCLGARLVVLRLAGNLFEKIRSRRVVEVFGL